MRQNAAVVDAPSAPGAIDPSLMRKVFYAFALIAVLSVGISVSGKLFGRSIAMAGHTDDTTPHEVVIGNDVLVAPANMIRFDRARRDGIASRLDLYMRWPQLDGYSEAARATFNHAGGEKRIIFASFEERMMSRDMSGRLEPIYSRMIVKPGAAGPGGVTLYEFTQASGYTNEILAVATRAGQPPFVARCLVGPAAEESLAPCERDVQVGANLSLTYRFPSDLLGSWAKLDAAMTAMSATILKTAKR